MRYKVTTHNGWGAKIHGVSLRWKDTTGATDTNLWTDTGTQAYLTSQTDSLAIGTTTPYSKLSIWGAGTGTASLFELTNSASTSIMRVLENGSVGIGTTSPYAKTSV
jgi:hypothetical protein